MGDTHSFNVDVARVVGVNAAILLQGIKFWCDKNRANGKHFNDGAYWTYNSVKAWEELYPYLGRRAIGTALKKLEDGGYIRTGNFNNSAYDRTKWYAITDDGLALFGKSIYTKCEMERPETSNGFDTTSQPIPVSNQLHTDTEPDDGAKAPTPSGFRAPTREEVRAYVREKGYHFDPDHFFDYYNASGWRMSGGRHVTSWRQCCVTWERRQSEFTPKEGARHVVSEETRRDLGLDRYTRENAKEIVRNEDGSEEIWY